MRNSRGLVLIGPALLLMIGCASLLSNWPDRSPDQPIVFSHSQHLENEMSCSFCHPYSSRSSSAGIVGVRQCMTCHRSIKADSGEVLKVKAYFDRNEEIPWVRVYGFLPEARVRFTHRAHRAAEVDCTHCHGDLEGVTVAERVVEHTMGWCVQCHEENREKFAHPELANDCLTCHF